MDLLLILVRAIRFSMVPDLAPEFVNWSISVIDLCSGL